MFASHELDAQQGGLSAHRSPCAAEGGSAVGWGPAAETVVRGRRADIAPEKIENVYARSPLVAQSFVHGVTTERQLVAVVVPDPDTLLPWAASRSPPPPLLERPSSGATMARPGVTRHHPDLLEILQGTLTDGPFHTHPP